MPTSAVGYAATVVAAVVLGVVLGVVAVLAVLARTVPLIAKLARGQAIDALVPKGTPEPIRGDPEAMAHQRIMNDAVERGAEQLIAEAKASGMALSLEQARRDAAAMLGASMPDPRGGVR